jgi:hypothetical protein
MAWEIEGLDFTLEAAADLSANQYFILKVDSSGKAALCGAGEPAIGALQNEPDSAGKAASIRFVGISKVVAGDAIAAGAQVASDASGKAITATTGANIVGIALSQAAGDGVIIPVALTYNGISA